MRLYGLLAQFHRPEDLIQAVHGSRLAGYRQLRAFTPFPVEDLPEALELPKTPIPTIAFVGGVAGGVASYGLEYFAAVWSYPWNVGGRPFHSWPLFVPVSAELTVLFSSLAIFFGLWILCGLPRPYDPVFNVPAFARASSDRFFLCVLAEGDEFDPEAARRFLRKFRAEEVFDVEVEE